MAEVADSQTKKREISVFLFLTLVLAPLLAVIIVATLRILSLDVPDRHGSSVDLIV